MADDSLSISPADPDRHLAAIIGSNLRRLRSQSDLSLEKLSRLANVSRAMLGQIELGKSAPTITVLARIAGAFDLPVTAFMGSAHQPTVTLLPAHEAKVLRTQDNLFHSRALFPFTGSRRVEFYELSLEPQCVQLSEAHPPGTNENLVVTAGEVEVTIGRERHRLTTGDAIYFAGDVEHVYGNPGEIAARAYLVMSYAEALSY